jgi:hypothetical protein
MACLYIAAVTAVFSYQLAIQVNFVVIVNVIQGDAYAIL